MNQKLTVHEVVVLAEQALAFPPEEVDVFVEGIDRYLTAFETWRAEYEASAKGASLEEGERALVEQLRSLHQQVIQRAMLHRDDVATQLGELRHRANALKKYVDRYPSRITIAGKREG